MRKVDDYEDGPGCSHNSHPESLPRATMTDTAPFSGRPNVPTPKGTRTPERAIGYRDECDPDQVGTNSLNLRRYRSRIRFQFGLPSAVVTRSYNFFSAFSLTVCGYYGASRNVSTWGASFNICSTTSFLTAPPTTCAISSTSPISRKAASLPKRSIAC